MKSIEQIKGAVKNIVFRINRGFKRCRIGDTILLLVFVTAFLSGCKNDVDADDSDIVENVEYDRSHIEYDEIAAQKQEVLNDSQNEDLNLDTMEIYESFLEGGLAVERKEGLVHIDELFWDNDIEYCFWDIDGDGNEELHIRDSVVYYAIKVCDKSPRIIFEGWWGYEPIVADGLCGILDYYHGYGTELVEFITIAADGSRKSDGEFYWSDANRNGSMDEADYYRGFIGYEEIDMEQYVRYREEQLAKQTENELEWTNRQLKSFAVWQEAYIDFIQKVHAMSLDYDGKGYSLIYVDDDDIPELYVYTGTMATGEFVVSFYDGNIGVMNRERVGLRYMEYGGLLYGTAGNAGLYPCNIYMLEKGKFSEIGTGWYTENSDEENIFVDYFWEDRPVTETEYEAHIEELIDTSKCIEPSVLYSRDEILHLFELVKE